MAFETLSDADLLRLLSDQGKACERVMAMPEEERRRPGKKGEASPEQAGTLNAMFAVLMMDECARRGIG